MFYGSKDWQKWVLEEADALPLLEHAYQAGINTWDTVQFLFPYCIRYITSYICNYRPISIQTADPKR